MLQGCRDHPIPTALTSDLPTPASPCRLSTFFSLNLRYEMGAAGREWSVFLQTGFLQCVRAKYRMAPFTHVCT